MGYKLFAIHYSAFQGKDCLLGSVHYEVAGQFSEALENAKPKLSGIKNMGENFGLGELEIIIDDVREVDLKLDGWNIRLERMEQ